MSQQIRFGVPIRYKSNWLHILLHGDSSMPDNINENIFKHVHEFIIDSKRF